jgi:hypothetical protein
MIHAAPKAASQAGPSTLGHAMKVMLISFFDRLERSTTLRESPAGRYLFEPHVNTEFGRTASYSRFRRFAVHFLAVGMFRLPLDLLIWAAVFAFGVATGARLIR